MSYYRNPEISRTVTVIHGDDTRVHHGDPWKLGRGPHSIWKPGLVIIETSDPYHASPAEIQAKRIHRDHLESVFPMGIPSRELSRIHHSLGRVGIATYADLLCVGSKNLLTQASAMYDSHLSESTVRRIGLAAAEQTGYRLPDKPATPNEQLNYCTDVTAISLAAFLPTGDLTTVRNAGYRPKGDGRDQVTVGDVLALSGKPLERHLRFLRAFPFSSGAADRFVPMQASLIQDVVAPFEAARAQLASTV